MAIYRIPITLTNPNMPSPAVNVWHCRTDTSVFTGSDWVSAGQPLGELATFYGAIKGYLAQGTVVTFPTQLVEVETAEETSVGAIASISATGTTTAPPGLALVLSWKTGTAARRGRGRTFLGPLTQSMQDANGRPSSAPKGTFLTAAQALLTASAGANGWALGVYGQESKGMPDPKVLRDFTTVTIGNEFAHLRSRRD